MPITTLSPSQARKLALHAQQLPARRRVPPGAESPTLTRNALEQLGYIQIDTISVVQRAHHHTLWNRNPRYAPQDLDRLIAVGSAFEYWSHAAAYLPMRDFRYSLPRKNAIASGTDKHWGTRDKKLMRKVLHRIKAEGPLMAKDFDVGHGSTADWSQKPAKQALEYLFMQGDLMISERLNFHKVYDITERVLPAKIDTTCPSPDEYYRFLINRYLLAHGIGSAAEVAYLRRGLKGPIEKTLKNMTAEGNLVQLEVKGRPCVALPASMDLLDQPLPRNQLCILSPFDNLLIQRDRVRWLFDFDYLIECYVPKTKRRFGYFVLPILWSGKLVARMDCKAHRQEGTLEVLSLQTEDTCAIDERFLHAFAKEIRHFAKFCDCQKIEIRDARPKQLATQLRLALKR